MPDYSLSFTDYTNALPSDKIGNAKEFFKKLDLPDPNTFFGDSSKFSTTRINGAKTSKDNVDYMIKKHNVTLTGKFADFNVGPYRFRFIISGKSAVRTGDAKTTRAQELGSLEVCKQAMLGNTEVNFDPIVEIFGDYILDKTWQDSYKAQFKAFIEMKNEFKWRSFEDYNREDGFMTWITNLVRAKFSMKKDTWNPADIWLVNKQSEVEKVLKDVNSIVELNTKLRALFSNNQLIGISLKKTGKTASYKKFNFDTFSDSSIYPLIGGVLDLSLTQDKFTNNELNFSQKESNSVSFIAQCRAFPPGVNTNIQISYKAKGASAEMGKVVAAFRDTAIKELSFNFPTWQTTPKSLSEFTKDSEFWKARVAKIIAVGRIDTKLLNVSEFMDNISTIYKSPKNDDIYFNGYLNQKFQCIELAYILSVIPTKELNEMLTKFVHLSQKQGDQFGPFIKVS